MIREIEKVKLPDEYKKKAISIIDDTIELVANKFNFDLSDKDKMSIRNLSLDQINVNITSRAKMNTMWVFDTDSYLPVVVEKPIEIGQLSELDENSGAYVMLPSLLWTFNKSNINKGGVNRDEFEKQSLIILMEDFETAAFYGTLSYILD